MTVAVEVALVVQDVAQGLRLLANPRAQSGDKGVAADEIVLESPRGRTVGSSRSAR